jgi:hypothetical protein
MVLPLPPPGDDKGCSCNFVLVVVDAMLGHKAHRGYGGHETQAITRWMYVSCRTPFS